LALTQQLDAVQASYGGKLLDLPVVGMRDETFRNCTLHARFGGATQIVAVEEDGVALRLHIFPRGKAERVYSVDGLVTAVRPKGRSAHFTFPLASLARGPARICAIICAPWSIKGRYEALLLSWCLFDGAAHRRD
jgi:hypothetical protein